MIKLYVACLSALLEPSTTEGTTATFPGFLAIAALGARGTAHF